MKLEEFTKRLRARLREGNPAASLVRTLFEPPQDSPSSSTSRAGIQDRRDLEYEASDGIREALDLIQSGAPLVLISGRAGTGKSRLIRYLEATSAPLRQIVVAPTGIAALNVGAATIHKTFMLPPNLIDARNLDRPRLGRELEKIDRLIIDEISMVRADLLDGIDARLRERRGDPRPFGGVQVVMVGDFLQLPPVTPQAEAEMLAHLGYQTPYAFSARVVQELDLKVVTLTKVWRQNDQDFIEVLGRIRTDTASNADIAWLNGNCHRPHREGTHPLLLTPTRAAANRYNLSGIEAVREARRAELGLDRSARDAIIGEQVFAAKREGSFAGDAGKRKEVPVPDHQPLLPGVRVLAVKNDPGGRFVNGSLGTVVAVREGDAEGSDPYAEVLFDGKSDPTRVEPMAWEEIRYIWNDKSSAVEKTVVGRYTQIPLALGYAVTIHKSQGLTLDDLRLDLGSGTFAPGQLYVALSRARTVEGLSFVRPIARHEVRADEILQEFLAWARGNDRLSIVAARGATASPPTHDTSPDPQE